MGENVGNDFATTLSALIADGVTTSLSVASGTGAPAVNFRVKIDDELLLVTSKGAGTNWTATRGLEGTTPVLHLSGALVSHVITTAGLENWSFENFAAPYPGAEVGKVRLVLLGHRFDVVDELVVEGELIVEGEVNLIDYS